MLLHISAVVIVFGCIFQVYMFIRTKRLINTKVDISSTSTQGTPEEWLPVGSGFNPNIDHPDVGYFVER